MKKTRWLLYPVFGLVFYLLFLIIEMPAAWFAWGLNRYTQGTVRLDPISGSLWSGSGKLAIYYPKTTPHEFGTTEWRINPFWLLTGRLQLSLQAEHQGKRVKTTLGLSRNSLLLKDTEAEFSATFVAQLYPPLSLISPQGKVRVSTETLTLSPDRVEGAAALEWQNAGSSLSPVQPLGAYRLEINGAGATASLLLRTTQGILALDGRGEWQARTGRVLLNGSAVARERVTELEPLLRLMGHDQGGGRRELRVDIPLSRPAARAAAP
ncbi:MAG: type II secretion system protein N [Pseudomonadota bacterium]